jgi:hypothetical protein
MRRLGGTGGAPGDLVNTRRVLPRCCPIAIPKLILSRKSLPEEGFEPSLAVRPRGF